MPRQRANMPDPTRRFDKTQCKEAGYGDKVHRDYLAHCLRWGWVTRQFRKDAGHVLDVGCGQDTPLARVIAGAYMGMQGFKSYTGVDMNKAAKPLNAAWAHYEWEFDFTSRYKELLETHPEGFDAAVNFEVIEHMQPDDGDALLAAIRECLKPGGKLYLSTPAYDGVHMAANHLHEYYIPELQEHIEAAGFTVLKRFGTFASWPQLKKALTPEHLAVMEDLNEWFGYDVACSFISPLYPDASRNNAWVCQK